MNELRSTQAKKNLRELDKKANKNLGQNFLVNKRIIKKIVDCANIKAEDVIIEIGPGLGALTEELVKKAKKIIAIEIDKELSEKLKVKFKNQKNVKIIEENALKFTVKEKKFKIIANIPYYITSPLIRHYLNNENNSAPEQMTLLVQKEVGEKITAKPGNHTVLSLQTQLFCEAKKLFTVKKGSFFPMPKVESCVIQLMMKNITDKKIAKQTERIFKKAFEEKRKTIAGTLSKKLKIEKKHISDIISELKLNPKCRPQELTIDEWIKLSEKLL